MFIDILKKIIDATKGKNYPGGNGDDMRTPLEIQKADTPDNTMRPNDLMRGLQSKEWMKEDNTVMGDDGNVSTNQSSPFSSLKDMYNKSRSNDNTGTPMLRQLLDNIMKPSIQPGTGTARSEELLSMPSRDQKQPGLAPTEPVPLPRPRPDYSMSTIDPKSIEELRTSLLNDSGQASDVDPNSLAGRMNGPYSNLDQKDQMSGAQDQADDLNSQRMSANADRRNVGE